MPAAAARSTARLDGAPTAATIGMPAASPSGPARSWRARSASARPPSPAASPRAAAGPTSLSTALWRPTSSCTATSAPSAREQRRGVQPARAIEGRLRRAQRARQPVDHRGGRHAYAAAGEPARSRPRSPSRLARPQTPHAALVTNTRALAASAAAADGRQLDAHAVVARFCSAPRSAPTAAPARPPRAGSRPPARRHRRACASSSTAPARRPPIRTRICSGRSIAHPIAHRGHDVRHARAPRTFRGPGPCRRV